MPRLVLPNTRHNQSLRWRATTACGRSCSAVLQMLRDRGAPPTWESGGIRFTRKCARRNVRSFCARPRSGGFRDVAHRFPNRSPHEDIETHANACGRCSRRQCLQCPRRESHDQGTTRRRQVRIGRRTARIEERSASACRARTGRVQRECSGSWYRRVGGNGPGPRGRSDAASGCAIFGDHGTECR